jgi:hypothetical protein
MDALRRDNMARLRPHGVMMAPFEGDLGAPAPFQRAIDEQHEWCIGREERRDEQLEQDATHAQRRPGGPVEHPMIRREMTLSAQPDGAQCRSHRAPS